jgi:hypothetical protein
MGLRRKVIHCIGHPVENDLILPSRFKRGLLGAFDTLREVNCSVVKPYPLNLFTHEPHTDYSSNLIVVENVRIHGIDRHGRTARFQNHKVTRLEWGHRQTCYLSESRWVRRTIAGV